MRNTEPTTGFTLLEMLIALALGALLMATISTSALPLLKQMQLSAESEDSFSPDAQAENLLDEIEQIAKGGILVFPHALDTGVSRSSLAIQFVGTGLDQPADANADGQHGIANMDAAAIRASGALSTDTNDDDDRDGSVDEDPINGIDDDFDGLVDEDPSENADDSKESLVTGAGIPDFDDNNDGRIDTLSKVSISDSESYWSPFLPNSLVSDVQLDSSNPQTRTILKSFDYRYFNDDNEDGVTNNSPAVTWSVFTKDDTLICTTPLLTHDQSANYATFVYHQYACMQGVTDFSATRRYSSTGQILITLSLDYLSAADTPASVQRTFQFQ